jgi:hypothetical protein
LASEYADDIETWLRESLERSGAIEFFEAKLNEKGTHP